MCWINAKNFGMHNISSPFLHLKKALKRILVTCSSFFEIHASVLPCLAQTRNIHHPIARIGHFYFPFQWSTDAGHVPRLSELANGLLLRLMVVVEETLKDLGVSPEELREVQRKRSYITACYFQAVTCY